MAPAGRDGLRLREDRLLARRRRGPDLRLGHTGFDYATMTIADDLARNRPVLHDTALQQADSSLKDVVRVTYVLLDIYLADPRMKIEIEVTALKQAR